MLCFQWKMRNSYVNESEKKIWQSEFPRVDFFNFTSILLAHYSSQITCIVLINVSMKKEINIILFISLIIIIYVLDQAFYFSFQKY